MSLFKRGSVYWYEFVFKSQRYRESTHIHVGQKQQPGQPSAKEQAKSIESAARTALAKGEYGIVERKPAPRLKEFAQPFMDYISVDRAGKPRTIDFYAEKLQRLLEYEPIANARLDQIDESLIDAYTQHRRKKVSVATVNRQLATLRRLLRYAMFIKKVINRVPKITVNLNAEHGRDFVLNPMQEQIYLAIAPQPLHDVAVLLLDTGMRVGEALALQWADVQLEPPNGSRFGIVRIREGKSKYARRTLPLTDRAAAMLTARHDAAESSCVFPGRDPGRPFAVDSLDHQHGRLLRRLVNEQDPADKRTIRDLLGKPKDFVIHSFRHTMLTRLGEAGTEAFTIQAIAGHSSVVISQKYVHPTPETQERAFERLQAMNQQAGKALPVPTKSPTLLGRSSVSA